MSIGGISASSFAQSVLSTTSASKKAWQSLQDSLKSGDLTGAKSAFASIQKINSGLTAISGSSQNSQLTSDISALGDALDSGNLKTAQSAFATVQSDMKSNVSQSLSSEMLMAESSVSLVTGLLGSANGSSAISSDLATASLTAAYSALNIKA